jgi:hypothetical protein
MYSRHETFPVYELRSAEISAIHFNHVQHALKRLGDEIRLSIPRLRSLDLILQRRAWVIVDNALNDVPIAAWTEFETAHRVNLHEPIKCVQKLYHQHAQLVLNHTIEAMELILGEQMDETTDSIVPFKKQE